MASDLKLGTEKYRKVPDSLIQRREEMAQKMKVINGGIAV